MRTRRLGELVGPAVGFGAMVLSPGMYGPVDERRAARALRCAIDVGSYFIDTSDGYGHDAHNERFLGSTLAGCRDEVVISTKFGYRIPPGADRHTVEVAYGDLALNASPEHVRGYALASLHRLRTDRIDLYSPHFPDPQVPIEETVGAMAELVHEGIVHHLGLSNVTADQLERSVAVHPISAVQCEWSLWTPAGAALLAASARHGVGVVAWAPLGAGLLAGAIDQLEPSDLRSRFPRYAGSNLATNQDRFAPLAELAAGLGLTPSQLALAWLLHQHPAVVPIPGSTSPLHIAENAAAADVDLTADELIAIDQQRTAFTPAGGTIFDLPAARRA